MTHVVRREGEDLEAMIKRFVRGVRESKVLRDFSRRRSFIGRADIRRRKARSANRRRRQQVARSERAWDD